MFIPLQHNQAEAIPTTDARQLQQDQRLRLLSREGRELRLGEYGAALFRVVLILICGIDLILYSTSHPALLAHGIALVIAVGALIAGLTVAMPSWALLMVDGAAAGTLILATGGAASPMLVLVPALVVQGGLSVEERDTLASAGIGVIVLLLVAALDPAQANHLLIEIAAVHVMISIAAVWSVRRTRLTLTRLHDEIAQRKRLDQDRNEARRALEWQRQNLAVLGACATLDDLAGRVVERAGAITGAPASFDDASASASFSSHTLDITGMGRLVVQRTAAELDRSQRDALEHLVATAAQRAVALRSIDMLDRHHRALMALWEGAGILRAAPHLNPTLLDVCQRIAAALDLNWMALIGPDERQMLAPLMIARGRAHMSPPRLQPVHFRLAAEVLRSGRSLVRVEQERTLAFLPVRVAGEPSLVLAARGAVDDAAVQALLLLLGDLIGERLAGCTHSREHHRC
ncbi:hypothetical protein [Roseiflexus sp.]|uniref:hypothetical protein n=1 Tax=Roseiflexus sp. TaxID=2562120 RepID=UPI0021DD5301|nr:hypothetical protein [Roseiflexus sp.]GIV99526.1 MAG: hypothetical protein KatS3mg058_0930 [Roseiflexus sp.]